MVELELGCDPRAEPECPTATGRLLVVGGPFGANRNCRAHCSSKDGTLVCLSVCPPGRLWSFCQRVAIHRLRALGVTHTGWAQVETGIQVACLCSLGFFKWVLSLYLWILPL